MRYVLLGLFGGSSGLVFRQTSLTSLAGSLLDAQSGPLGLAYISGNAVPGSVRVPARQALDFALVRDFSVTEQARLQFRAKFFNGLNHTNLGTPNRFVNTPQFGSITEAATPGRQVQLSARISL
jgi:hypothetical protein